MAAQVTETEAFERPADEVFDYLVDFSNLAQWDPLFDRSRRLTDGPVALGTAFEVVVDKGGVEVPITYTIDEYTAPSHARLIGEGDGFTSIDTIDIRTTGEGCELTWNAEVTTEAGAVDTIATPVFRAVAKASMAGLRSELGEG